MSEQPVSRKRPPIRFPQWDKADAAALQALAKGVANEGQQVRALKWIVEQACATYDFCDHPENERLSAIFDGRRFAGMQVVKLVNINLTLLKP